jgi:hypothetical protein
VIAIAALLPGCASVGPPSEPAPVGRITDPGFSLVAPPGAGWMIERATAGVMLSRQIGSSSHTQVALVTRSTGFDPALLGFDGYAKDREVFTRYVKAATEHTRSTGPEHSRFVLLEDEVATDSRFGHCARVHEKTEDHTPASGDAMLIMETWGYTCLLPSDPRVIVQIAFSDRAAAGARDEGIARTREAFFDGFRFVAAISPAAAAGGPQLAAASAGSAIAAPPRSSSQTAATPELLVLAVDPALRAAVRKGFGKAAPGLPVVFEGEPRATDPHRELRLSFLAEVDRSGQMRNRDGAAIGGLATVLLGGITPWSCPVTHRMHAELLSSEGAELRNWDITYGDKHVGTMLACPDVDAPEAGAILELEKELIRRMRGENLLAH